MATDCVSAIGRPVLTQLREQLEQKLLRPMSRQRLLPSALMWRDDATPDVFEALSALPEHYPTQDEINLFGAWGGDIAAHVEPESVLIDLGCGNMSKIQPLLDRLEEAQKPVRYFALDLSSDSLERNLARLRAAGYKHVQCAGLCGTFDDVRAWAAAVSDPIWYLSLGSIFGNDEFDIAVRDLRVWSSAMRPQDRMLIGLDGCRDPERIWKSYNTPIPGKPSLVEHGLQVSNAILGHAWYRPEDWEVRGVTEVIDSVCTFRWVVRALREVSSEALGLHFAAGDEILTTRWFKWDPDGMQRQFDHSGFQQVAYWQSPSGPFYQYLVKPVEPKA